MIKAHVDKPTGLTALTCTGQISLKEVSEKIREFYESGPTMNVLWDISDADASEVDSDDVKALANFNVAQAHSRKGGKTAIVAPGDMSFGLSRMFQSFSEMAEHESEVQIFRSVDEAKRWIEG